MPFVSARVCVKDDDPPISVSISHEQFIGLRVHMHIRGAVDIDLVIIPGALARLADLQEELSVARELQDMVVARAFAGDPEVALVIDVETVNLLGPVVAFTRAAPTFNVVTVGVELHDRRCRHAALRLRRIRCGAAHIRAEAASVLGDPDMILRVNGHTADRSEEEFLRHLWPEWVDLQDWHIAALCHQNADKQSCRNRCSQTGMLQAPHTPSGAAHYTKMGRDRRLVRGGHFFRIAGWITSKGYSRVCPSPLSFDAVGDDAWEPGRLPGVEAASQVRDVAEAGTPQNAGGDGAPKAAFAVHHDEFFAVQFRQLSISAFRAGCTRDPSMTPPASSPSSRTSSTVIRSGS